jgi:starch synthase
VHQYDEHGKLIQLYHYTKLKLRILFVTSEAYPLIKTGGLADVSGSLPIALSQIEEPNHSYDVRILLPGYPAVVDKLVNLKYLTTISNLPQVGAINLMIGQMPDSSIEVMVISSPELFNRTGGPYTDEFGQDWADNPARFSTLSLVAAILSHEHSPISDWIPDVVHCNDWQSGLTPAYLHFMHKNHPNLRHAKSLLSIHNLAFQGCYPAQWLNRIGLSEESFHLEGLEYYGQISFLKAGIVYADGLATVSPTYAQEIQTEAFGFGLQGLLHKRGHELHGILNGLDTKEWDPMTDPHLQAHYHAEDLSGKATIKQMLQKKTGLLVDPEIPLLGVVSRLTHQKGLDLLIECASSLVSEHHCQLIILGSGEKAFEEGFKTLAHHHPKHVSTTIGYNEPLSHQIMAGADMFIMPSRFEPCGLNQMYGLHYGTPPIVTHTGGLADTVIDSNPSTLESNEANGFVLPSVNTYQLEQTIKRAMTLFKDKSIWRKIQINGMKKALDWSVSAKQYAALYQKIIQK